MTTLPFDLGRYRCTEQLGEDALSEVFRVEIRGEEGFKKAYTLTRFRPQAAALPGFLPRVTRDALRNATLEHGGVVRVLGFERLGDAHVLLSDHLDGISLGALLGRLAALGDAVPWNVAAHIAIEVAKTLDYAHGAPGDGQGPGGVVHGALDPRHVLLTWEGAVRVLHLGLALTLSEARARLHAADPRERAYQSPEQLAGQRPGPRSDLFALGAILYEMLAGRPLYEVTPDGSRRMAAAPAVSQGEGAALLKPVLKRLLAPRVEDRFESAEDAVMALQKILVEQGQAVSVTPLVVWLEQASRIEAPASEGDFEDEATMVRSAEELPPAPAGSGSGKKAPAAFPSPSASVVPVAFVAPAASAASVVPAAPAASSASSASGASAAPASPIALPSLAASDSPAAPAPPVVPPEQAMTPAQEERRTDSGLTPSGGAGEAMVPLAAAPRPRASGARVGALVFTTLWALAGTAAAAYLYLEGTPGARRPKQAKAHCPACPDVARPAPGARAASEAEGRPSSGQPAASAERSVAGAPREARDAARPGGDAPREAPDAARPGGDAPREAPDAPREGAPGQAVAPSAGTVVTAAPGDPEALPGEGEAGAGELKVVTAPRGVTVSYRGRVLGETPLRLRAKKGRPFLLVLNKEKHQVQTLVAKTSGYGGQTLRAVVPVLAGTSPLGVDGQSRVTVRCRTPGVHRIFLNGRDTGRNCPASLRVGLGTNNAGIYLPEPNRTEYKFFRAKAGDEVILSFDH